jgi:phospholipase/carboxylesterase
MRRERFGDLDTLVLGGDDDRGGGDGPAVVLLHGFGAPGDDLVPLSGLLGLPPTVRLVFPAAPLALPAFFGDSRAWWMIDTDALERDMAAGRPRDRSAEVPEGLAPARDAVAACLDEVCRRLAVPEGQLVLGGFSQGAMLSCDVALRGALPLAGLVLLSGTLLCADQWAPLMAARGGLPVLQSHGRADPLLSFEAAERLRDRLRAAELDVEWHAFDGGHEIPPPVLSALGAFLRRVLVAG